MQNWQELIFSDQPFEKKALEVFSYQYEQNAVYRRFFDAMVLDAKTKLCHPELVSGSEKQSELKPEILKKIQGDPQEIPLLPIKAFKDAEIVTTAKNSTFTTQYSTLKFQSSGTGGMEHSMHWVKDAEIYRQSVLRGFKLCYDLDHAVILGYTPGYSENPHSSLIWMVNELIKQDTIKKSRFLPLNKALSQGEVDDIAVSGRQLILFGAAFGLLDLIEYSEVKLPSNSVVIETGGMKTYRREMSRKDIHKILARGFGLHISRIHSEYGMCELLSQAYATGGKWFQTPPWMQVSVHDADEPQRRLPPYKEGIIGFIDLANVHSCSFILTGDRGVMDDRGCFQVLGRWNPKDLRGCNFLIDED